MLYNRAARDVAMYGNRMHYPVLDVLTAHDTNLDLTATYVAINGDNTGIAHNNLTLYLSPETRCWTPLFSLDQDGTERTARRLALSAAGTEETSIVTRFDFFNADMPEVTDVPAGFAANTTTPDDPVFYMHTPRVGDDLLFDTVVARNTHTATVRIDI